MGLILLEHTDLRGDPIRLREFDAPESRCRGEKFDAYALALVGIFAEIHDSAFLLIYTLGMLPGGWLIDRIGPQMVIMGKSLFLFPEPVEEVAAFCKTNSCVTWSAFSGG